MADVLDILNSVKEKVSDVADTVSTAAYKGVRETKEKIDNSFSGKNKRDSEARQAADRNSEMERKMKMMGGISEEELKAYSIDESGLEFDSARNAFNEIDENEYSNPDIASAKKVSEQIEDWLYNKAEDFDYRNSLEEDNKKKTKVKAKLPSKKKKEDVVEDKYDKLRLSEARRLREGFDSDIFDFKSKNAQFLSQKVEMTKESVERFSQLDYIINAFAGDKASLSKVDDIANESYSKRMVNVLKDYLEGKSDCEETGRKMFLEVHGVDHTKVEKDFSESKMVSLCVLEAQGVESLQFINLNAQQLEQINTSIRNKEDLGNKNFLYKNLVSETIGKTREEGDQIKLIEQNGNVQDSMLFENGENGEVSVYHDGIKGSKLIARQDINGEFIKGTEDNIINMLKRDDITRNELEGHGRNSLTHLIDKCTEISNRDKLMNPMSKEELEQYRREEEAELRAHNASSNPFLNT